MSDFRHDPKYVARRRQIIRENHPDRGGSDEQLIRALRELDDNWSKRQSRRVQFEQSLPDFVPEDVAREAYERAEVYIDRLSKGAQTLRKKGEDIRRRSASGKNAFGKSTPVNPAEFPGKIAKTAGRVVGSARNVVRDQVNKRRRSS